MDLGELIAAVIAGIGWLLRWFFNFVAWALWAVIDPFLAAFIQMIPISWITSVVGFIQIYGEYLEVANRYIPLSEFVICFVAYLAFLAIFVAVKFVLKLVPTIG